MSSDSDYFEGQNDKDCTIHSINNAFGRRVATKELVLTHIETTLKNQNDKLARLGLDDDEIKRKEDVARNRYSSGKTFFAADIVWDAVKHKGLFYMVIPIPGVGNHPDILETVPELKSRPIIILGRVKNGYNHAIAVRDGMIYDSEYVKSGPRPITTANLKKSLHEVYGAYVFAESKSAAAEIKRILRTVVTVITLTSNK
jgi:hypothetical protein